MRIPRFALPLTASLVAAVLVSAQSPHPQQPTFRGGTNVVRVDLYATREGGPVEDLKITDIELTENGVRQTIDSFERVLTRPTVAQELRAEPNNVPESRQMAADARARVFVLFLDTYHTRFAHAAQMRGPLQQFLERVVGQDDVVGVMTPEMSANDVTLGRRTSVISRLLDDSIWGRRGRLTDNDPVEESYEACYAFEDPAVVRAMKARRRETMTLDALDDLVVHLGGVRDGRKAVLAVSEGWLQYRQDQSLARPLSPNTDANGLLRPPGPVERGATRRGERATVAFRDLQKCEVDRIALANLNNTDRLQRIGESANRGNISFYPLGAQGLSVFDSASGPEPSPGPAEDAANLRTRVQGLRYLAEMTDGVAIVDTNNTAQLLRRVVDDMSSYYLLTYASTNAKLDGEFRSIDLRVSRPGVRTRYRRGYRALTASEVPTTISGAAAAPVISSAQRAVLAALSAMAFNPRAELRLRASSYSAAGQHAFLVVGTLDDATRRLPEWAKGSTADVTVRADNGRRVLTTAVPLGADGGFAVAVSETGSLAAGDYSISVRVKSSAGATIEETAQVSIARDPLVMGDAVVWRRRPTTGPAYFRTADSRASRTDRLRFELATPAGGASARLLDRTGQPMAVPVLVSTREDGGVRWIVAEIVLAPLAPGDYAVEIEAGDATRLTAFRVTP